MLVALVVGVAYLVHLRRRNAGAIDVAWGINLALIAFTAAVNGNGWWMRKWVYAIGVGIASLRLTAHLTHRFLSEPEDGRYATLRAAWGASAPLRFLGLFALQGLLALLVSAPAFAAAADRTRKFDRLERIAMVMFVVSVIGEAVADAQLAQHKARERARAQTTVDAPLMRGSVCRTGLWAYSRHPNYFFQCLMWVAYAMFAVAPQRGIFDILNMSAVVAPALMIGCILFVTGIVPTEKECLRRRPVDYEKYRRQTSMLVPWIHG